MKITRVKIIFKVSKSWLNYGKEKIESVKYTMRIIL